VLCREYAQKANLSAKDVVASYVIPVGGSGGVYTASHADQILHTDRRIDVIQVADVTGDEVGDLVTLDSSTGIASLQVYTQHSTREELVCVGP
jgi:hypothetical protein